MFELEKISPATYLMPKQGGMRVPGLIISNEELINHPAMQKPLEQVYNVAHLPGIQGYSIAMPDIHWGYGFPIGGVAAMDAETGVISPGGVGYDINCGVRLAIIDEKYKELTTKAKEKLLQKIYQHVPSGVGKGHKRQRPLNETDYRAIAKKGARWSVEKGFGFEEDLLFTESLGFIEGADAQAVSPLAKKRGEHQVGTIGSGNHFVEIGEVVQLFDQEIAKTWQIKEGQIYLLIHSGSRGFGHQVCQDILNSFMRQGFAEGLPDKQLVAAPIKSEAGEQYFRAMAQAANFAFNNRQQILHAVRQAIYSSLGFPPESVRLIYDVCHNIAKFETYEVEGVKKKLCVHRKGATRAFGPGSEELHPLYKKTGQPVLVPGDMGRASFLMAGLGNPLTWSSCCHGAGREKSRIKSFKSWKGRDPISYMKERDVEVKGASYRTIAEEMPDAYKDVQQVVQAAEEASLATIVAKLRPHLVVKG